jgi:hypothetical protein
MNTYSRIESREAFPRQLSPRRLGAAVSFNRMKIESGQLTIKIKFNPRESRRIRLCAAVQEQSARDYAVSCVRDIVGSDLSEILSPSQIAERGLA